MRLMGLSWDDIKLRTGHSYDSNCARDTYFMNCLLTNEFDQNFENMLNQNMEAQHIFLLEGNMPDASSRQELSKWEDDEQHFETYSEIKMLPKKLPIKRKASKKEDFRPFVKKSKPIKKLTKNDFIPKKPVQKREIQKLSLPRTHRSASQHRASLFLQEFSTKSPSQLRASILLEEIKNPSFSPMNELNIIPNWNRSFTPVSKKIPDRSRTSSPLREYSIEPSPEKVPRDFTVASKGASRSYSPTRTSYDAEDEEPIIIKKQRLKPFRKTKILPKKKEKSYSKKNN